MRDVMTTQSNAQKLIKGATGDWEVVIGMEVHAQVTSEFETFFGRVNRVWRRTEFTRIAGRCRDAGNAAGDQ